jgi:hypothetical protein
MSIHFALDVEAESWQWQVGPVSVEAVLSLRMKVFFWPSTRDGGVDSFSGSRGGPPRDPKPAGVVGKADRREHR